VNLEIWQLRFSLSEVLVCVGFCDFVVGDLLVDNETPMLSLRTSRYASSYLVF
jgi:hypothetical protein